MALAGRRGQTGKQTVPSVIDCPHICQCPHAEGVCPPQEPAPYARGRVRKHERRHRQRVVPSDLDKEGLALGLGVGLALTQALTQALILALNLTWTKKG